MKRILFLSLILLAAAASLFAQETITGIAADLPILMHRSQATPGAFPLPWGRSNVMYDIGEQKFFWSFGWGRNLETELGRGRYGSKPIHSYSIRWKVPCRSPLDNGIFASANHRPYTAGGKLDFSAGYIHNLSGKLSLIPSLKLNISSPEFAIGISAAWVPLRMLSGNWAVEYSFDENFSDFWSTNLTIKGRLWKGLFFEDKLAGGIKVYNNIFEYSDQSNNDWSITIRQELYLGIMF